MDKTGDYFADLGIDLSIDIPHLRMAVVTRANRFVFRLFAGVMRNHGPDELLPLTQHLVETHILLRDGANGECGIELELAGLLHDVFEGYCELPSETIEQRLRAMLGKVGFCLVEGIEEHLSRSLSEDYKNAFVHTLTGDVLMLIRGVTEVGRIGGGATWKERKVPYLEAIESGDRRLAMLSSATKSSGLVSAVRYHKKGLDTGHWSAGTHEQNIWFHETLLDIYRRKSVPRGLLTYYERVFSDFRRNGIGRV